MLLFTNLTLISCLFSIIYVELLENTVEILVKNLTFERVLDLVLVYERIFKLSLRKSVDSFPNYYCASHVLDFNRIRIESKNRNVKIDFPKI